MLFGTDEIPEPQSSRITDNLMSKPQSFWKKKDFRI